MKWIQFSEAYNDSIQLGKDPVGVYRVAELTVNTPTDHFFWHLGQPNPIKVKCY